jgi:hypothetical protein
MLLQAPVYSLEDTVQRERAGGGITHHCIDNDDCTKLLESVCHHDEWKYRIDEVVVRDRRGLVRLAPE